MYLTMGDVAIVDDAELLHKVDEYEAKIDDLAPEQIGTSLHDWYLDHLQIYTNELHYRTDPNACCDCGCRYVHNKLPGCWAYLDSLPENDTPIPSYWDGPTGLAEELDMMNYNRRFANPDPPEPPDPGDPSDEDLPF